MDRNLGRAAVSRGLNIVGYFSGLHGGIGVNQSARKGKEQKEWSEAGAAIINFKYWMYGANKKNNVVRARISQLIEVNAGANDMPDIAKRYVREEPEL
ncbi:hypothetical protein ANCCEY_02847 [Ancylostoma ceylanicum]|uniref:Uncharacterized protein n=1 Tax=Ancylostoma ceylanicum TaxID=53326 RepID=A0A0D6M1V1_9BILA|nr:hypothetical protein ANCCEY_02847 [Ancylostoma ceylanicum]